jgi:hypothetical protein
LIIESYSSESTSGSTSPMVVEEKEKIDTFLPSKLEDILKTDLKISQELKQMSETLKPIGRLNEKFIELME